MSNQRKPKKSIYYFSHDNVYHFYWKEFNAISLFCFHGYIQFPYNNFWVNLPCYLLLYNTDKNKRSKVLLPLAGLTHIGYNFGMIPLPLRQIQDCETPSFVMDGFTNEEMMKRVKLFQESVYNISKSNIFFIDIVRKKPEPTGLLDNVATGAFLSMNATTVDINKPYLGNDSVQAGTISLKHLTKRENGGLEVTFRNPTENIAEAYFLRDSDGKKISPDDGSALMPTQYYFWIEVWKWVIREGVRTKTWYARGMYHVDGNLNWNFDTENKELQTFSVSFTRMSTGLWVFPDV